MHTIKTLLASMILALCAVFGIQAPAFAQAAPTQFTLSAAITTTSGTIITVSSASGFNTSDSPSGTKIAMVDAEAMRVISVSGTQITVARGILGTGASTHASGAVGYVEGPRAFMTGDRDSVGAVTSGTCTATNEVVLPFFNVRTGRRWNCIGSRWLVDNGYAFLSPTNCFSGVSAGATGTNGYSAIGTGGPVLPIVQAQNSATGVQTTTHFYTCNLNSLTGSINTSRMRNISLMDVTAVYGVQGNPLNSSPTQVLTSGIYNSRIVFQSVTYNGPTSTTARGFAEWQREDSGTMAISPILTQLNTATTTPGEFFTMKFTPGVAIQMTTDLKQYYFVLSLLNTSNAAAITNLAGLLVHFAYIPDELM